MSPDISQKYGGNSFENMSYFKSCTTFPFLPRCEGV